MAEDATRDLIEAQGEETQTEWRETRSSRR